MIIVDVRENESIDKALKQYKFKYNRAGIMRELRNRQQYNKPSVVRRNEKLKAVYRQKKQVEMG
ncbi:MAG: 30S ribosomal protein S21 [Phaeodactylibacter sp.]|nr:30S ribosomal protein S21 [Phaeodactylibacter sp.]MCB9292412.1 30S ribosomal protein S21 [Lewinellaceae bacterium]MCO6489972.1 30S ribosomal protein S21 [Phaeodactylibacter sp.]